MRALLDAIPDLMFRITADGTYVDFVGDAELLANPWEDVVGGKMDELLPAEVAGPSWRTIREALETGTSCRRSATCCRRSAATSASSRPRVVPIDDNEVVTIVRDATELRQTERELRAAHDRLVRARDAERRQARAEPPRRRPAAAHRRPPGAARRVGPAAARRRRRRPSSCSGRRSSSRSPSPRSGSSPAASTRRCSTDDGLAAALAQLVPRLEGVLPVDARRPAARASTPSSRRARTTSSPRRSRMPPSTRVRRRARCGVRVGRRHGHGRDQRQRLRRRLRDDRAVGSRGSPTASRRFGGTLTIESPPGEGTTLLRRASPAAPPLLSEPRPPPGTVAHRWLLSTRNAGLTATNPGFTTLPV